MVIFKLESALRKIQTRSCLCEWGDIQIFNTKTFITINVTISFSITTIKPVESGPFIEINLFILDNNSIHSLCACFSILILKKIKDPFCDMKKNDLVEFSKNNDVFCRKKNNQNFCI